MMIQVSDLSNIGHFTGPTCTYYLSDSYGFNLNLHSLCVFDVLQNLSFWDQFFKQIACKYQLYNTMTSHLRHIVRSVYETCQLLRLAQVTEEIIRGALVNAPKNLPA